MPHPTRPLDEYLSLLERENLLSAPLPQGLDRNQPITLVSCDSRTMWRMGMEICSCTLSRK